MLLNNLSQHSSKDMISCVFLSRNFPFAWLLDKFQDVFSGPNKQKNCLFFIVYGVMKDKWTPFWPPCPSPAMISKIKPGTAKNSLTSSSDEERRVSGWEGGQLAGAGGSTGSRRAILAGSASWLSIWTWTDGQDQTPGSCNQWDSPGGRADPARAVTQRRIHLERMNDAPNGIL